MAKSPNGNGYRITLYEETGNGDPRYIVTLAYQVQARADSVRVERRGESGAWSQLATVSSPDGFFVRDVAYSFIDTSVVDLQRSERLSTVDYRITPFLGIEPGITSLVYNVTLPTLPRKERIWPRHEIVVTDIVRDVRRLTGDRVGMIISDEEVLSEINEVIYEAWPTYGELWRYTLTFDEYQPGRWYVAGETEQAVPWAVRYVDTGGQSTLLTRYTYDGHVLTVPSYQGQTTGTVQFEVMMPPLRPELDTSVPAKTTVSRRYVVLAAARACLSIYGERTGVDVEFKQRDLDMQLGMEALRTGGGPSRDLQGVAHG